MQVSVVCGMELTRFLPRLKPVGFRAVSAVIDLLQHYDCTVHALHVFDGLPIERKLELAPPDIDDESLPDSWHAAGEVEELSVATGDELEPDNPEDDHGNERETSACRWLIEQDDSERRGSNGSDTSPHSIGGPNRKLLNRLRE